MKQIASPGSIHETGCSGLVHWDDPEGWGWGGRWEGGSGWGTYVHPWLIHVNVWQKPLQYCKVISLQLKKKKKKRSFSAKPSLTAQGRINGSLLFPLHLEQPCVITYETIRVAAICVYVSPYACLLQKDEALRTEGGPNLSSVPWPDTE